MGLNLAVEALGVRFGGGATVLTDLISNAVSDDRFSEIRVFSAPRATRKFELPGSEKLRQIEYPATENRLYRWWWLEHRLEAELNRLGADVFLSMCGAGLAGPRIPQLTFIQQSLPFSEEVHSLMTFPERLRVRAVFRAMKKSCEASEIVLVQTRTMKDTVAAAFGIPPEKIDVVASSVAELARCDQRSPALEPMRASPPGNRILYVGSGSAYKNIDVIVRAAERLGGKYSNSRIFLTLDEKDQARPENRVVRLGYLGPTALAEAYRLADVLVMPSLQETVGLPMLEAMSAGLPVVAADRPYAREVCEDAALFFNPSDHTELASCLSAVFEDSQLRSNIIARGLALSARRRTLNPYRCMLDAAVAAASRRANCQ